MKYYKKLVIIIVCLIITIISTMIINNFTKSKIILAVISDNTTNINQNRSVVLIDLNKNKIIKTLYSSNIGHDLEASISPDRKKIAYNKWSNNKMDRNLYVKEIDSNTEIQLTSDITGEINRISWLDNNNILYVFSGHDSSKFGYGDYIYIHNLKTNTNTLIDNKPNVKSDYKYNTVRFINGQNKIIFTRGSYTDFLQNFGKLYENSLYICDMNGSNEKKLISFNDKLIGRVIEIPNSNKLAVEAYYYDSMGNEVSDIYTYDLNVNKLDIMLQHNTKFNEYWNILSYDTYSILFTEGNKLYTADIRTKEIKEIHIKNLNNYQLVWLNTY